MTEASDVAAPEEHEPTPLEELWWLFKDAGLPFPPLPRGLADRLQEVEPWVFATRPIVTSPWDVDDYLEEAVAGSPPDYVLVAHTGYGVNSWAIHYFLVQGGLGIFLQIPWGGAYTDNDAAVARLRERFAAAADLIEAASQELDEDDRLVAVETVRHRGQLARFKAGTPTEKIAWRRAPDPMLAALMELRGTGAAPGKP